MKQDAHTAAAQSMRSAISRALEGLCRDLEKAGKAAQRVPCLKVEGRAQVALAAKLRARAERTGWVL